MPSFTRIWFSIFCVNTRLPITRQRVPLSESAARNAIQPQAVFDVISTSSIPTAWCHRHKPSRYCRIIIARIPDRDRINCRPGRNCRLYQTAFEWFDFSAVCRRPFRKQADIIPGLQTFGNHIDNASSMLAFFAFNKQCVGFPYQITKNGQSPMSDFATNLKGWMLFNA